jgi:outer membrane protein OmpA-like peptidoglycan-associated protein
VQKFYYDTFINFTIVSHKLNIIDKKMRNLTLLCIFGLFCNINFAQNQEVITEKRNVYNVKGDYYSGRNEYRKAIVYYNMAFQHDGTDFYSVLKKADVYTKLKLYPQAEESYRITFESNLRIDNQYRLKYAMILLVNNKIDEFRKWLDIYNQSVNEEIKGENYLVSKEKRIQLYKDTAVVLTSANGTDTIPFKIKYEGYQFKKKNIPVEDQLFIVLGNGNEYSIKASGTLDFNFSFQPMEDYRLIIQQENVKADNILSNKNLTPDQRKTAFLKPMPIQKDELKLQRGMKYQFSSGKYKIPPQYVNTLKEMADASSGSGQGAVDLTALVKELQLSDEGVYTISFVKAEATDDPKKFEVSTVTLNDQTINIYGQSFVVVLPDRVQENFAIQTDIEVLKKNFNPKKQTLIIDEGPLFKESANENATGLLLTVNTDLKAQIPVEKQFSANEISIIPGMEYILTLSKPDPNRPENIEIIVPLTKGVKYNLGSIQGTSAEYKKALAELLIGREGLELTDEEVIDISVLSKELEVKPGEIISFYLMPVKQFGKKQVTDEIKSNLYLDGKTVEIGRDEKLSITIPYNVEQKFNFQTDLKYMEQNFNPGNYTLRLDTTSFLSEITIDTAGLGKLKSSGWLCVSVNTDSIEEVDQQDRFIANELSIITGKEYILTVSKIDAKTGKKEEIIIPLLRQIKYDFTSFPESAGAYEESIKDFIEGRKNIETEDGTVIDITLLSKELKIQEGDEVSFSLLPVKKLSKYPTSEAPVKSSLIMDNKVVEFTNIQKYTINMPLTNERQVNLQTNIDYLQENFNPASFSINIDTAEFFSEITIDTAGLGNRVIKENINRDPVFDVVTVNFNLNEYALSAESVKTIENKVIDQLNTDNRLYVTIKGYTDALGDPTYNLNLSKKRAESVKGFLRSNGIGESRIRTLSFGASQLINKNINWKALSESELRKYRKVEIIIYIPK